MDLTRTERLILETACEMFELGISPAEASLMSSLDVSEEEQELANGHRLQLGDLLVARGNLTADELGQVLDKVFDELHAWSDSLAAPEPVPVPRPAPKTHTVQLGMLVQQLTGLLDVLVGDAPAGVRTYARPPAQHTIVGAPSAAPRLKTAAELNLGENLLGIDPSTIVGDGDAEEDEGTAKIAAQAEAEDDDDDDEDTRKTLQVERAPAEADTCAQTLQLERAPAEADTRAQTLQLERAPAERDTLQLERPEAPPATPANVAPGDTAVVSRPES